MSSDIGPAVRVPPTRGKLILRDGFLPTIIFGALFVLSAVMFSRFEDGPNFSRGLFAVKFLVIGLSFMRKSIIWPEPGKAVWYGMLAGMTAWISMGVMLPHFGFMTLRTWEGLPLFLFMALALALLWKKLPIGFAAAWLALLLHWGGYIILTGQLALSGRLELFEITYRFTGVAALLASAWLAWRLLSKEMERPKMLLHGLWLYVLLVVGVEGVLLVISKNFGF